MTARELIEKYLSFFVEKGHEKLPNVSLVPENDPTTLFISAGMQPLIPYLLGEPHPLGKRLVSLQKCLRTGDVEEVGDVFHNTFFEMLGNWSLGDYWKEESLSWSLEFLIKILSLNPKRLHVTIFKGDKNAPRDEESEKVWLSLGIPKERIYPLPKEDNWWEAGETGPGGPDSEIFYDLGKPACGPNCRPGDNCGRFFEMWNNVFMEYNRKTDGSYEKLEQKNVDTGMGVERTVAVLQRRDDIYQTELFLPIIGKIREESGQKYEGENIKSMRIVADHLRAAVFLVADRVIPSNKERGYVLRRLIRRATVKMMQLNICSLGKFIPEVCQQIIDIYKDSYFIETNSYEIYPTIGAETDSFIPLLHRGTKLLQTQPITGNFLFDLHQTYGFPFELVQDLLSQWGKPITNKVRQEFEEEKQKHRELSRRGVEQKFAGGLADQGLEAVKLHTATHLLHAALREILGKHVQQKGSNITSERLRFDFSHPEKLTLEESKRVEDLINQKIKRDLPVGMEIMSLGDAQKQGALAFFGQKYGHKVKVYTIGHFSKEVCGGPHVASTGELGRVRIIKSEKIGGGLSRIYATLKEAAGR